MACAIVPLRVMNTTLGSRPERPRAVGGTGAPGDADVLEEAGTGPEPNSMIVLARLAR